MNHFDMFNQGVVSLAGMNATRAEEFGMTPEAWKLLTQEEPYNPPQAIQLTDAIKQAVEVALSIVGLPVRSLPGHYVALVIAKFVDPRNWLVACAKAPDSFLAAVDAQEDEQTVIRPMRFENLIAITMAYGGGMDKWQPPNQMIRDIIPLG